MKGEVTLQQNCQILRKIGTIRPLADRALPEAWKYLAGSICGQTLVGGPLYDGPFCFTGKLVEQVHRINTASSPIRYVAPRSLSPLLRANPS